MNQTEPLWTKSPEWFSFRGLAREGIIREGKETIDEFNALANYTWSEEYEWRAEHYNYQFQIMRSDLPTEYYLAELAIWDLRVLVQEVYYIENQDPCVYKDFWKIMKNKFNVSAVVNLNYDTTFDDAIKVRALFYPGKNEPSENRKPIIRPHGSLEWTSVSKFSIPKKDWCGGWNESYENTDYKKVGYKKKRICCSIYQDDCKPVEFIVKNLGKHIHICVHKIERKETIKAFFNEKSCKKMNE